jgi:DNA topoisomerase-2
VSACDRYIHTHLTDVAHAIFNKHDGDVLRHLEDDGVKVEPAFYLPVVPMVLVNGAMGIGTGYSTSVPCYNPADLVRALRMLLDHGEDAPLPELTPWYRGFQGSYIELKGRLCSRGIVERTPAATKVRVTELPLGYWTEDFKETLEALIERTPAIKNYTNGSTDERVDYTVTFDNKASVDAWLTPDVSGVTRLEHELKMVSNKGLSTSNMHLFNARGQIRKYDKVTDIVREFYAERMDGYVRRREAMLLGMRTEADVLQAKSAFLDLIISEELRLDRRCNGAELDAELEGHGLPRVAGSYKYLLGMAMSSLTIDRKEALDKEVASRRASIAALEGKDARDLWRADLATFEAACY